MNALVPIEQFRTEIAEKREQLTTILPPHIDAKRFEQTAIIAVQNNPDLLQADRKSLHSAVTRAAEDGLHPDGREGVITIYNTKVKRDGKEVWEKHAQWTPMVHGIRKRARELCDMVIDAQVVYANDRFVWRQGDAPCIEHTPAPLGKDRGDGVGVYAIFKIGDQILHREVMDVPTINAIKGQSRQQGGLMWTKFWTEAWKKCAIRRGIKTVPSVQALEQIIKRDDIDFDFGGGQRGSISPPPARSEPVRALQSEAAEDAMIADDPGAIGTTAETVAEQPAAQPAAEQPKQPLTTVVSVLDKFVAAINAAETTQAMNDIWAMWDKRLEGDDRAKAIAAFDRRFDQLGAG